MNFSHAVIPDGFHRESILCFHNHNVHSIIGVAGAKPGIRQLGKGANVFDDP
jgi:hypothetical protein